MCSILCEFHSNSKYYGLREVFIVLMQKKEQIKESKISI